jgi:hypothetical protein
VDVDLAVFQLEKVEDSFGGTLGGMKGMMAAAGKD